MNQREPIVEYKGRATMPERHECCIQAWRNLWPQVGNREWYWVLRPPNAKFTFELRIVFCPWCGERLPNRGKVVTKEVGNG